jgi:hypothetical protein
MKFLDTLSHVFAVTGVLLILCSVIGRFMNDRTIFGNLIEGGITAPSVLIGANTFLLLAILSHFYKKQ